MIGKLREVFVYNESKKIFLAFRVRVVGSTLGRFIGLGGTKFLRQGEGLWIVPAKPVHTIGVRFPFDVVMLDRDFRVVSISEMVKPFRVVLPKTHAESVMELPAHTIFRSRTEVGDQLLIDRYEATASDETEAVASHA